jgi:hypothetical protein
MDFGAAMFCERCGSRRGTRRVTAGWAATELRECPECTTFVCSTCWNDGADACLSCAPVSRPVVQLGSRRQIRPAALAGVATIAATLVLGVVLLPSFAQRGDAPAGDVAAQTARPSGAAAPTRSVAAAVPSAGASAAPSAAATLPPAPSATGAPSPSARPSAAPSGEAEVEVSQAVAVSWTGDGATRGHVVAGVTNEGDTAVALDRAGTPYEVRDEGGDVVTSGRFTYPMPSTIAPGETAWFVDTMAAIFVEPEGDWSLTLEPQFAPAAAAAPRYAVTDVDWNVSPDGKLVATGQVTNDTTAAGTQAIVTVILLDARGRPLAGLYDLTDAASLAVGESRAFETDYPGAPPVDPELVADVVAFASEGEP